MTSQQVLLKLAMAANGKVSVHNSTIKVRFRTIITWQCQPTYSDHNAVARTFMCPSRELKHFHYTWCFLLPKSVIGFATHFGIKKTTVFQSSDTKIAKINKVVMLNVPILLLSKPLNQNNHVFTFPYQELGEHLQLKKKQQNCH